MVGPCAVRQSALVGGIVSQLVGFIFYTGTDFSGEYQHGQMLRVGTEDAAAPSRIPLCLWLQRSVESLSFWK